LASIRRRPPAVIGCWQIGHLKGLQPVAQRRFTGARRGGVIYATKDLKRLVTSAAVVRSVRRLNCST
jgi:hypothetical protein